MFMKKSMEIPVEFIEPNDQQPRKNFEEEQLMELRDSIREFGVLQPLIVKRKIDGRFMLIAGERRLRASLMAGLDKVPVIVKNATDEESGMIALVENIQRENLGYIEEAKAYKMLMVKYGITQLDLSERLGKNQSTISNKMRILNLPEDIQKILVENRLTERHARALLKIDDDQLRTIIVQKVIKHNFNVKQTEKLVDEYLNKKELHEKERNKVMHISYKLYINTLKKAFNDMNLMSKGATFIEEDTGEDLILKITIPKNYRNMSYDESNTVALNK